MEPRVLFTDPADRFDPVAWEFRVRHSHKGWLSRPEPAPGAQPGNADTWTSVIPDSWPFDTASKARAAAIAHGCDAFDYAVIPTPRCPAAWLSAGLRKRA